MSIGTARFVMSRVLMHLPLTITQDDVLVDRSDLFSIGVVVDALLDQRSIECIRTAVRDSIPAWATVSHVEAWPWREWRGTEMEAAIVAARSLDPDSVFELVRSMR